MDVMEAMSAVDIGAPSNVDRKAVAGSLPLLAKISRLYPGKVAIIAGDEIHQSGAAAEVVALAELLAADVYGSTRRIDSVSHRASSVARQSLYSGDGHCQSA